MKASLVISLAATAAAVVVDTNSLATLPTLAVRATGCNADNCLRAVRATRYGTATMAIRMEECSSFLAVTETPAPTLMPRDSTVFVTETNIETLTANITQTLVRRQVTSEPLPTKTIPSYASACSNEERYISACSCYGATASTTTVPASTVTSTVTIVSTTALVPFVNDTRRPALSCSKVWNCGDGAIPACSGDAGCVCFRTVEGQDVCALPNDCTPSCDSTSDCGLDEVCIKQSCCHGGTCMKVNVCLNEVFPKVMFRRRGAAWVKSKQARTEFTALSLAVHDVEVELLD
ncbi:hypothetical protein CCHL11_07926 [Colletotrichum chlorophyti]|uniref:Uncharacterized protein n=1 Tax=Colletotrichum chlorophyti TaxID=708187 RepID=A0A1Q8S8J7_9PEZI|nr:hypothetical protein CCHL11_07926 [Colletotrichum chlorophyti]